MIKYYNIPQTVQAINNSSGVICIGTGRYLERIIEEFPEIAKRICVLADNDIQKQGQEYCFSNTKKVKIVSLSQAEMMVNNDMIVIIAVSQYYDILDQLKQFPNLNKLEWIIFRFLFVLKSDQTALLKKIPDNLNLFDKQLIPKVIHYCWFGKNPIPDRYKEWMRSWKKFCPDYEIVEWNESNYDINKNQYMYQAYKAKKWGFVPDYARLDIIYKHGGIYLDTDVELVKNLDHLLYQKAFAGFESDKSVALGLGFGAQKGHLIIKEMLEQYEKMNFIKENGEMNLVPSPVFQTQVLLSHGLIQNGEFQTVEGMNIYPEKMFCAKSLSSRLIRCTDYTCSIHHYDASWQTDEIRNKVFSFEKEMQEYYGNLV